MNNNLDGIIESEESTNLTINDLEQKIMALDARIKAAKILKEQSEQLKAQLTQAMIDFGVPHMEFKDGVKITLIQATEPKWETKEVFDVDAFKDEMPGTYELYLKDKPILKSGRSAYVRITVPKEK